MKKFVLVWCFLCVIFGCIAINRPVYKVAITQKGYTQFLQYDLETPPIRQFTWCAWLRFKDFTHDQTILSYVANGNRELRLWLESGGSKMKLAMEGRTYSGVPVNFTKDVWHHVCISFQSDYGAWALYFDSQLVHCESLHALGGYELPADGSVIIGYGTDDNGSQNGIEGEVYGVNMILSSTIERNYTLMNSPHYRQKLFRRNKLRDQENNNRYIILENIPIKFTKSIETTTLPVTKNHLDLAFNNANYNFFQTTAKKSSEHESEKEILDFTGKIIKFSTPPMNNMFWDIVNKAGHEGKFKKQTKNASELYSSSTQDLPTISMFETPPPVSQTPLVSQAPLVNQTPLVRHTAFENFAMKIETSPSPHIQTFSKPSSTTPYVDNFKTGLQKKLLDVEVPPPPEKSSKVFGQWTSSKFAGSVLNYLKSINYQTKQYRKVPPTIPLTKISDSFPYASIMKTNKVHTPLEFQRRHFADKTINIMKRNVLLPQINVEVLKENSREEILRSHAQIKPNNVKVTVRGQSSKKGHRHYRNVKMMRSDEYESMEQPKQFSIEQYDSKEQQKQFSVEQYDSDEQRNKFSVEQFDSKEQPKQFNLAQSNSMKKLKQLSAEQSNRKKQLKLFSVEQSKSNNQAQQRDSEKIKSSNYLTILPFLKSVEYFTDSDEILKSEKQKFVRDMYSRSSSGNKWHNIKSYNNDYTPRRVNMNKADSVDDLEQKVAEANRRHPSILLKYVQSKRKLVPTDTDEDLERGREIAEEVSNQSNHNIDSASIVKYNHGYLPSHQKINKKKTNSFSTSTNNFDKPVKIGNALNEKHVIGTNEEENKRSFVGGNERIPDIHRYRSDIDEVSEQVPPSLSPRVCIKSNELDHSLYIKPDDSIVNTDIDSPIRSKNIAMEFIHTNYQKCSLKDATIRRSNILFINWDKTPVRLFGGAKPLKTKDLCGFF